MTRADIELACREGWLYTDEARLLGIEAKSGEYYCTLSAHDDSDLLASEDHAVTAMSSPRSNGEMCAPKAISVDAIRLACKEGHISSDFARSLGVEAQPKYGSGFFFGRTGCQLSPADAQALERDEAGVVRSR
jgi:hypothetical protein